MSSQDGPSFHQSLIAGAAAGICVDLSLFPVDTIKTRLQSEKGFLSAGGFRGLYKGIGSPAVGAMPGAAIFFAVYDSMKQNLPLAGPALHITAASAGEVAACLIRVPTDVIKTRMQASSYAQQHAKTSLSAARIVWANEGLAGFYRGYSITIMREIPFTSIQFPLYEFLKARWAARTGRTLPLPAHEAAVCGTIAGGTAAFLTTPLDVIRTRIMLDMRNPAVEKLPGLVSRASEILRREGPTAFFQGAVPRTGWIAVGGAVFLGVYEKVVNGLMVAEI